MLQLVSFASPLLMVVLLLVGATVAFAQALPSAPAMPDVSRRSATFNSDWRFIKADPGTATMPELDDSTWRSLDLPHDWSIEGPFAPEYASGTGFAPGGIAWYRKHFKLDASAQGKLVAIEFDGVYANAQVYLNGFLVGGRPFGFSSFECDLTPYLRFGGADNVIAVRVDHSRYADSRFYTGSGIYRNVRLRVTDKLHVATHGIFITTPQVTDESATARVECKVENASGRARKVSVQCYIIAPDGTTTVGTATATAEISGDSGPAVPHVMVVQDIRVDRPQRWLMESPALYTLRTRILEEQTLVDETSTTFGIRTIRFDADKGFFLNDKSVKLKGVCIHHDAGCLGAAVPEKVLERRLRLLQELGVNAIRTSHNPPAPELLDLCDRLGLVVMDEAFDEFTPAKNKWISGTNVGVPGRWGYAELFDQWAAIDMGDLVLRDRNHPSVIMWSIGNEVDFANDPFSEAVLGENYKPHFPPASELTRLGKPLVDVVKKLDPTRPVTAAMANMPISDAAGFADLFDVAGYNYQEPRYAADHAKYPKRIILGSENNHRFNNWTPVRDNEFIAGQFLWTGIDYLGESRGWPSRGSTSGLLDTCGFKKPNAWFRQSLWADKPMVYLCTSAPSTNTSTNTSTDTTTAPATNSSATSAPASSTAPAAGGLGGVNGQGASVPAPAGSGRQGPRTQETWNRAEGSTAVVHCYTNCQQVQLTLNDKPIGTKRADEAIDGVLTWTIPYQAGTLKAVGLIDGKPQSEFVLKTAGAAQRIQLSPDVKELRADGQDICHLAFVITDAAGVRVPDAKNLLSFKITGPVKLLGIDNGEMTGVLNYSDNEHAASNGRGLAILQSTGKAGAITIEVTSPGLESAKVDLVSR
ncbi:MAG: DUF4982 domain-containing protein [Burkholderiales bacterium]|nr:DUF4982 domain-containing protein [Phycisphaerae bacterium]